MIRTCISKTGRFAKRVTALVLSVIMVAMILPFGTLFSASAADDDAIFVFTNKNGVGITGISVTITIDDENDTTQQSNESGEVYFNDLVEDTTYVYSVDVGNDSGYAAIADGSFTFKAANDPIAVTVYAKTPSITEEPQSQTKTFGEAASFSVSATGLGILTYQWLLDGTAIIGKTESTLTVSPVTAGGVYSCTVTSDLAQEDSNTATSSMAILMVESYTPTITIVAAPDSGSVYNGDETTITATISSPENVDKPTGNVEFYVNGDLKATKTASFDPIAYSLVLNSGDHSILVKYGGDSNYKAAENTITHSIDKATPTMTIVAAPSSGSVYNGDKTTITATITSPEGVTATPTGNVEFYVNGDLKAIKTASFDPIAYSLVLNSGDHSILVKYGGDSNYKAVDTNSEYSVGKVSPVQDKDYIVNTPNGTVLNPPEPDLFGWYKAGGQLEITPTGLFDQISESKDGGWLHINEPLIKTAETLVEGTQVTFYLRNSTTGEVSNPKTITYKLDSTVPDPNQPSFNLFRWQYKLTSQSDVSGIYQYEWRYRNEHDIWNNVTADNDGIAYVSLDWWRTGIVVKATDKAGNGQDNQNAKKMSNDKIVNISYSAAVVMVDLNNATVNSADANTRFIHSGDITGTLTVSNDDFDINNAGISITATKDGGLPATVPIGTWTETEVNSGIWVANFSVSSSVSGDGVYVFSISSVDGYRYYSSEYEKPGETSYKSNPHIIDTTPPQIRFEYAPASLTSPWTVFGDDYRVATIFVEDKNFRPDELSFFSFSAVNSEGRPISNQDAVSDSFLSALQNRNNWGQNGDSHSAQITFSVEAIYTFVLSYTDIAGNPGQSTQQKFAIDRTAPTELKVKYHTNPISTLFSAITFGFYNPSVTIELIADDATSDIEYFSWNYLREAGASTINKDTDGNLHLDAVNNSTKTATAQFTLTADEFAQYRGTISFTATDKAGNVSERYDGSMVDSNDESKTVDVLVIDTIAPTRVVTFNTPTQIRDKDSLALFTGDDTDKAIRVNNEKENESSILYYTTSVTATIKITETNFYTDDVIVKVNSEVYTNAAWAKTPNSDLWTGTVIISAAGVYDITVAYTDKSGNIMNSYQSSTIHIDGIAPTVDSVNFAPAAADEVESTNSFIDVLEYGFYFKTDFIATVHVSDADPSSGLDKLSYRLVPFVNGVQQPDMPGTADITEGVATISIPAGFKGQIFVEAFDNTRNTSGEKTTQAYVIDNTAPTITVAENNTTPYTDAAGKLYTTDMSVTVTITDIVPGNTDTVSGIKEIGYAQSSEKGTYARINIQLNNTGYTVDQNLGDGWTVAEMDNNLVTKVTKTFTFNIDDNDIVLTFDAKDRSENQITNVSSNKFTIDKTAPVINITFRADDDSDVYYSENRIADITVIERNFNANLIKAAIENKIGAVPGFTFTGVSNTEYAAVIDFFEGDYTFAISGTDLGNQTATVNYAGGNENLFFVDKTDPVIIEENFKTFSSAATKDSFNTAKTATIKIAEHNFDPALTNLKIFRKTAGEDHNNIGFTDVTQQLLNSVKWADNGDLRTITFTVSEDAVYQIEIAPADLAGRTADPKTRNTVVFEIDKTAPVLTTPEDKTANVYVKTTSEEPSAVIRFNDNNIKEIKYRITAHNFIKDEDIAYLLTDKEVVENTAQGATINLPDKNFEEDGIYEIRATAYDNAGNESGEKMYTYVVMRKTAMLAYIPKQNLKTFHNIGKRAMDFFEGIQIFVYTAIADRFDLKIGETLLSNGDYIIENKPDEQPFLNQIKEYKLVIPQMYIAKTFNEDSQVYDMPINVLNANGQILTLGQMVIDNVKPFGEFEAGMKEGKGYYNVDSQTIKIIKLSDDIDPGKTEVLVNNEVTKFVYDAAGKTITITLDKSRAYGHPWAGHNIKVTLVDTAGNEHSLPEISNVYIGNWFYRYWSFFTVGGIVVVVGGLLWWKPWRKKEEV